MGEGDGHGRPLLVLVNPRSGTGHSKKLLDQVLKPLLDLHKLKYEVIVTEYAGHGRDLMVSDPDLGRYRAVVAVSGDGLINEVYTGLYSRFLKGEKDALRTPVGMMPGGSGCALNCSLLRQLGQPLDGLNSLGPAASARNVALGAAGGTTKPLDLIEVELGNGERHVSFLGVTLGVIADGDIGTEWMRCIGFLRVYLYIGWRTLFPLPYKARVSYLPLERDDYGKVVPVTKGDPPVELPPLGKPLPDDQGWVTETDTYHVAYALNLSMLDPMTLFAPESTPGDGVLWMVFVRGKITRPQLIRWFSALPEGPDFDGSDGALGIVPVKAFRIEPLGTPEEVDGGILSLDAESVHFGPVQGRIAPQAARILAEQA